LLLFGACPDADQGQDKKVNNRIATILLHTESFYA